MTDFPAARDRFAVRLITENAECPEVAEKTLREFTSDLRDLRALRVLRVDAAGEAGKTPAMEARP